MIFNIEVGMKNVTASLDSTFPADATVTAGGQATFKVVVADNGIPKEHTFQWFVNDTAVEGATEDTYVRDTSGDKGVLSVWCEVTNKAGTASSRHATLTVKKVPVLNTSYPENLSVTVASSVAFAVAIAEDGYPASYTYQWYVNGVAISGATASRWTDIATPAGTRNVYCIVTNEAGSVQSRTATLSVSAKYFYSSGTFLYGGSYDWTGNSDSLQECGVSNGAWYLKIDGGGHFGATWGTVPVDLTGISKVIFTVSTTYTSGYADTQENIEEDIGWGWMGVVQSDNLGNVNFVAGTSVRLFTDYTVREFAVDVSHLNGYFYPKFAIDRTAQRDNHDELYISAIRFE